MAAEALEQASDDQREFEKARFDYCMLAYESEAKRQQQIETKASFYLSLVTLFLGVTFFNFNSIETLSVLFESESIPLWISRVINVLVLALGVCIVSSISIILYSCRFLPNISFYPEKINKTLFGEDSENIEDRYLQEESISWLYLCNAKVAACSAESRRLTNKRRAKLLLWVEKLIGWSLILLAVILGTLIYYTLY